MEERKNRERAKTLREVCAGHGLVHSWRAVTVQ